jgi:hypothetical protein
VTERTRRVLAGLLRRPDAGEVVIAGTPTTAMRNRARTRMRRDHVAFVYQSSSPPRRHHRDHPPTGLTRPPANGPAVVQPVHERPGDP